MVFGSDDDGDDNGDDNDNINYDGDKDTDGSNDGDSNSVPLCAHYLSLQVSLFMLGSSI